MFLVFLILTIVFFLFVGLDASLNYLFSKRETFIGIVNKKEGITTLGGWAYTLERIEDKNALIEINGTRFHVTSFIYKSLEEGDQVLVTVYGFWGYKKIEKIDKIKG